MPKLSIIIPAYNESERLPETLVKTRGWLTKNRFDFEILVVSDGSNDGTEKAAAGSKVISYQPNRGKGFAVRKGMLNAAGELRLLMDADNSTPVSELPKLLKYIDAFPIVIGSRYLEKEILRKQPLKRRFLSRLANFLIRLLLLPGIKDTQCGFKLFKGDAAERLFKKTTVNRWGFDFEVLALARKSGYKIKEVGVLWKDADNSHLRAGRAAISTLKELFSVWIKVKLSKKGSGS